MRVGVVLFLGEPSAQVGEPIIDRFITFGREAERLGLDGVWVGDFMGRGRPSLDPLLPLAALCSTTDRIELGTCVLQLPLRNPVELAHRVQTLNVLSKGRFTFGVGTGSTRADFELLGVDFEKRFGTLEGSIELMRRAWRGEPINGVSLSPWRVNSGGPPVLLGAWRSPRWIGYAAESCDGWIASGMFSKWEEAKEGIRRYRQLGGKRAVLGNVLVDVRKVPGRNEDWPRDAEISLFCPIDVARERLAKIEKLGFDDIVLRPPDESPEHLEMIAELLQGRS